MLHYPNFLSAAFLEHVMANEQRPSEIHNTFRQINVVLSGSYFNKYEQV